MVMRLQMGWETCRPGLRRVRKPTASGVLPAAAVPALEVVLLVVVLPAVRLLVVLPAVVLPVVRLLVVLL